MPTIFQVLCSCIKCKQVTTTGQLTRNHKDKCPTHNIVKFPRNFGRNAWNKGLTVDTDERVKRNANSIKNCGKPIGKCSDPNKELERRKKLSEKAKNLKFGGYRENAGRSKKYKVVDSFGKNTTLQSSYELKCSELLNELSIQWIRPKALKYDSKNYFADFYLPKYDLYLDPKNDYKAKLDADKIKKVIEQNNVRVVVLLQTQLTKQHIASLVQ